VNALSTVEISLVDFSDVGNRFAQMLLALLLSANMYVAAGVNDRLVEVMICNLDIVRENEHRR
jgi:hypothetical protein